METEIELKLFFLPDVKDSLIQALNTRFGDCFCTDVLLSNAYFDTPDLKLRSLDMGLRIRGRNGEWEQTIKTAGRVSGGIHARPEYNVSLKRNVPRLGLFPASIWPAQLDVGTLEAQLECIFHTDFKRLTWRVPLGESRIEIALDEGRIAAGDKQAPLCELEFELLEGRTIDLLSLAESLSEQIPMRLGKASKAQRGYQLAGLADREAIPLAGSATEVPLLAVVEQPDLSSTAEISRLLDAGLERWQRVEAALQPSNPLSDAVDQAALWVQLRQCIGSLEVSCRHAGLLTTELVHGFSAIQRQLAVAEEGNVADQDCWHRRLESLWRLPAYGRIQLVLVRMLLSVPA